MSPKQYYFPYFFDDKDFNDALKSLGLSSYVIYNDKIQMPNELILIKHKFFGSSKSQTKLLAIPFGMTMMFLNNELLYWDADYDQINLNKVSLVRLSADSPIVHDDIDISKLCIGHNTIDTKIKIGHFATFVRKEDLRYDQDYFEKFVIVRIENNDLHIIPFEWFNKTGGDYGYVWPATARLDETKSLLYGQGMRMANFTVDLNNPAGKPF